MPKHKRFLQRLLKVLPSDLDSVDCTRQIIAFFAISGLDLLNAREESLDEAKTREAIEWIYRFQVAKKGPKSGFRPSMSIPQVRI